MGGEHGHKHWWEILLDLVTEFRKEKKQGSRQPAKTKGWIQHRFNHKKAKHLRKIAAESRRRNRAA